MLSCWQGLTLVPHRPTIRPMSPLPASHPRESGLPAILAAYRAGGQGAWDALMDPRAFTPVRNVTQVPAASPGTASPTGVPLNMDAMNLAGSAATQAGAGRLALTAEQVQMLVPQNLASVNVAQLAIVLKWLNASQISALDARTVAQLNVQQLASLSTQQWGALQANQNSTSLAARKKKFETEFGDWIAAQNTWVEKQGIPGADLRPW